MTFFEWVVGDVRVDCKGKLGGNQETRKQAKQEGIPMRASGADSPTPSRARRVVQNWRAVCSRVYFSHKPTPRPGATAHPRTRQSNSLEIGDMHSQTRHSLLHTLSTILTVLMAAATAEAQSGDALGLIYSATADFRHDSIPTAIEAMKTQGPAYKIQFDNTEDPTWFTDDRLAQYDVLVFLMNTGEGKRPKRR